MNVLSLPQLCMFPDGSRLLLSTQYCDERQFQSCLYLKAAGDVALRAVGEPIVGRTCTQAHREAYRRAQAWYPAEAASITPPPYIVCCGPDGYAERPPEHHPYRSRRGAPHAQRVRA